MVGSAALDRGGDDLAGLFVGLILHLLLDLLDLHSGLVADLILHALQQELLCLLLRQSGNAFQGGKLLLADLVGLGLGLGNGCQLTAQVLLLALEGFSLLVQRGFLLLQTTFLLAQLGAAFFNFLFVLRAGSVDLILGFQQHFLFAALTAADGFVDQTGGLCLSRADLTLAYLFPIGHAQHKADQAGNHGCAYCDQNNFQCSHKKSTPPF